MNIVQRLCNYRKLKIEIKNLCLDIEELRDERNLGPGGAGFEERSSPTYKFNSLTENEALDLLEKTKKLEEKKRYKEREIERIDNAISILEEKERLIIEIKHINNKKWDSVTYNLDRSYCTCKSIEVQALKKLEQFLK